MLITKLFARTLQWPSLNPDRSLHTQCVFTQGWLNYYYTPSALSCTIINARSDEGSWSVTLGVSPSQKLFYLVVCIMLVALAYLSIPHACWFTCLLDLLVCICVMCILYTLPLVALSLSISFTLMIFVLAAFAYCFHVKWYYFHLHNTAPT